MKFVICAVLLISNLGKFCTPYPTNNPASEWNGKSFDFVVVGGGVAGCTVARRLAESEEKHTVLLIELGGLPHPKLEIPLVSVDFLVDPTYVNTIPTVTQKFAGLANNGTVFFYRGTTLGGGSAVNGMVLNRGSPHDYNNWAEITGDSTWSYVSMLKYFRRYENYHGRYPIHLLRGFDGPITISTPKYAPVLEQWLGAGEEMGLPVRDPNGHQTLSFAIEEFTQNFGRRVSSFYGFIRPLLGDQSNSESDDGLPFKRTSFPNLFVLINSEVTKLILEGDNNLKAVGVEILTNSTIKSHVRAKKEIILSSGAIGSPLILQKSGIGPRFLMERERIPLRKELPVGLNLHDHVLTYQNVIFNNRSLVLDPDRDKNDANFKLWLETGDGPFTNYLGAAGQAFLLFNRKDFSTSLDWANVHFITEHQAASLAPSAFLSTPDPNELTGNEVQVSWMIFLTRPKSRGALLLNSSPESAHGFDLDFRYLTHPDDLPALVEAIKFTTKLCEETRAFQSVECRLPRTGLEGCTHLPFRSDEYYRCYVMQTAMSGVHAAGSNKMGRGQNDPEAVVDTQLRVNGIAGLRVADASIMPQVTNANTQGPTYAIAEKVSELILKTWKGIK